MLLERLECGSDYIGDIANLTYRNGASPQSYCVNQETFGSLNFVNVDWFDRVPYEAVFLTNMRGCYYNCIFCNGGNKQHSRIFKRKSIIRSPEAVAKDLDRVNPPGHLVHFTQDISMPGIDYMRKVFNRKRNLTICNDFIMLPSKEMIDVIRENVDTKRSVITFSLECLNEKYKHLFLKKFTYEQLVDTIKYCGDDFLVDIYFTSRYVDTRNCYNITSIDDCQRYKERIGNDAGKDVNVISDIIYRDPDPRGLEGEFGFYMQVSGGPFDFLDRA